MPSTSVKTKYRNQTQAPTGSFGLLTAGCVTSPYYRLSRLTTLNGLTTMANRTGVIIGHQGDSPNVDLLVLSYDNSNMYGVDAIPFDPKTATDAASLLALGKTAANNFATTNGFTYSPLLSAFLNTDDIPASATSYQTIVSQTGTAAPSAGITPITTYPSGTTFTWARSSAGVYTLTASTAVFSTTKTAVFISPLTNLNAQARGVVTSTTVITFTTAIGSLLGLGLLGFTATNTDALLSNTMVYVQTYA